MPKVSDVHKQSMVEQTSMNTAWWDSGKSRSVREMFLSSPKNPTLSTSGRGSSGFRPKSLRRPDITVKYVAMKLPQLNSPHNTKQLTPNLFYWSKTYYLESVPVFPTVMENVESLLQGFRHRDMFWSRLPELFLDLGAKAQLNIKWPSASWGRSLLACVFLSPRTLFWSRIGNSWILSPNPSTTVCILTQSITLTHKWEAEGK